MEGGRPDANFGSGTVSSKTFAGLGSSVRKSLSVGVTDLYWVSVESDGGDDGRVGFGVTSLSTASRSRAVCIALRTKDVVDGCVATFEGVGGKFFETTEAATELGGRSE